MPPQLLSSARSGFNSAGSLARSSTGSGGAETVSLLPLETAAGEGETGPREITQGGLYDKETLG